MNTYLEQVTRAVIAGVALLCLGLAAMYLLTHLTTNSMNRFTEERTEKAAQQTQARQAEAEHQRQRAEFERERRAAFDAQYVAPKGCDNPHSSTAFTECVNHKMLARQAFFDTDTPAGAKSTLDRTPKTSNPTIKAGG